VESGQRDTVQNATAGGHAVPVSPETREVLKIAHQVSDWTGGTSDVTFGALLLAQHARQILSNL